MSAYLDTHVTLWLYAGETARISKRAATLINKEALLERVLYRFARAAIPP